MVDAAAEHQTVGTAVLVYHCDAVVDGITGVLDVHFPAVQINRTGGDGIQTKDSTHDLTSACAYQTGKAEDLACAELEVDVSEAAAVGLFLCQLLYLKDNVADRHRGVLGEYVGNLAAYHAGDQLIRVVIGCRAGFDPLAVADDGDVVRDAEDLVHLVGDVQNRYALFPEGEDLLEQYVDLLVTDGRGRLIHNDDRCVARDCLCDLDQLVACDGQLVHLLVCLVRHIKLVEQLLRVLLHLAEVYELALSRLAAQPDVLCDGHFEHRIELLIDHCDAHFEGILHGMRADLLSLIEHLALIGNVSTVDNLHQRGFTCAVLAADHVYLAGPNLQFNAVQRTHAGKYLDDVPHFQYILWICHAASSFFLRFFSLRELRARARSSLKKYFGNELVLVTL